VLNESDERRFERFYHAHHDRVAAYLLSRTDRDSAQDALARVFEIAWRRFDDVPTQELSWLLGVARRTLAGQRRAQGRRAALVNRIAAGTPIAGSDQSDRLADRQLVAQALERLSGPQREAVLLIAWDGLSQQEAAIVVGCSRVAFAVRLHRARQRLSAVVEDLGRTKPSVPRPPPTGRRRSDLDPAQKTSDLIEETT
jgi:RNA polymerase sigma-70 factor (ECF subfamily)